MRHDTQPPDSGMLLIAYLLMAASGYGMGLLCGWWLWG